MTDEPLRIWATYGGDMMTISTVEGRWKAYGTGDAEYHLHTHEALAQSPIVQAMIAEAVGAEREACAQVAMKLSLDRWREYKDRMSIYCASTHHEGMSDGASDVATAIRARGEG